MEITNHWMQCHSGVISAPYKNGYFYTCGYYDAKYQIE